MTDDHLKSGWAYEPGTGATYHFEHIPARQARSMAEARDAIYLLLTINWTQGERDQNVAHLNKYFAMGLASAVAMAARMEIEWQDVAEELVAIRIAEPDEVQLYWRVMDHYHAQMPPALSDDQAAKLEPDND